MWCVCVQGQCRTTSFHTQTFHPNRHQHQRTRSDGEILFATQLKKISSTTRACCRLCFHVPTALDTPAKPQHGDPSPAHVTDAIRSGDTLRGGTGAKDGRPTKHLSNQQLRSLQSRLKALADHVRAKCMHQLAVSSLVDSYVVCSIYCRYHACSDFCTVHLFHIAVLYLEPCSYAVSFHISGYSTEWCEAESFSST